MEDEERPAAERQMRLDRKLEEIKQTYSNYLCTKYSAYLALLRDLKGPGKEEKQQNETINFLRDIEANAWGFLKFVRMSVGKENHENYKYEENAQRKFVKSIRDYFAHNPNPNNCRKDVLNLLRNNPLPTLSESAEPTADVEMLTPLAALRKPISNPALGRAASKLPGPRSRVPQPTSRVPQPTQRQPRQQAASRMQQPISRMQQPTRTQPQRTVRPPSAPARSQRSPSPALARPTIARATASPRTPIDIRRPPVQSAAPRRPQSTPSRLNNSMMSTPVQGQGRPYQTPKSPVENLREKVAKGVKQLKTMKSRQKNATTIKQKLENLTKRFCASKR